MQTTRIWWKHPKNNRFFFFSTQLKRGYSALVVPFFSPQRTGHPWQFQTPVVFLTKFRIIIAAAVTLNPVTPVLLEKKVDHLGMLMPRLTELRLERGSTLASFRDLGSSLANLRILWLPACGVRHLDGVGGLLGLEELYLAFNDVEDLTSIALHDHLEVDM